MSLLIDALFVTTALAGYAAFVLVVAGFIAVGLGTHPNAPQPARNADRELAAFLVRHRQISVGHYVALSEGSSQSAAVDDRPVWSWSRARRAELGRT